MWIHTMTKAVLIKNNTQLKGEVTQLRQENDTLRNQVKWLKQQLFGSGKSEVIAKNQLELLLSELNEAVVDVPATNNNEQDCDEQATRKPRTTSAGTRRYQLPEHLEVKEAVIDPEEVTANPEAFKQIGEEVTEELDLIPPQFIKRRTIRRKFVSKTDKERAPIVAPAPKRPIERGIAAAGLLVYIIISKYCDHLPLYRQEIVYKKRYGVSIKRKAMCEWVSKIVADWLKPIYDRMYSELIQTQYIQADETTIKYIDPDGQRRKTHQGYMWTYSSPGHYVLFDWKTNRKHENPAIFLGQYDKLLQSDGYEAYKRYASDTPGCVLFGCWSHTRRHFTEALEHHPKHAAWVLLQIKHLYAIEDYLRKGNFGPAYRTAYRRSHSKMIIKRLYQGLRIIKKKALPKSKLGEAVRYALGQWKYLVRFIGFGKVEIDNNSVENAIRPIAVGRKNWLFIGHPDAGDRSAIIYSIIASCYRLNIEPYEYLTDILKRAPYMTNKTIGQLTPLSWKQARMKSDKEHIAH